MTNENEHSNSSGQPENNRYSHHAYGHGFRRGRSGFDWATTPGFHPGKLAAVVVGTALFPPLGLAALAYFLWNHRRYANAGGPMPFAQGGRCGHSGMGRRGMRPTGNAAFDEHAAKVLNDLAETRRAFAEHRAAARARRDAEAFAQFQAAQQAKPESENGAAS